MLGAVPGNYIRDVVKATHTCQNKLLAKTRYFDCQRFFSRTIPFSNTCGFPGWTGGNRCGISAGKGFFVKISNYTRDESLRYFLTNPGLAAVYLARHRNGNSVEQRFWRLEFWSLLMYFLNVSGGFAKFFTNLCMPFFWCFLNSMQSFLLRWPRKAESEFQNHLQCQGHWGLIFQEKPMAALLPCFKKTKTADSRTSGVISL